MSLVADTPSSEGCTTREYSFDADSNRTRQVTRGLDVWEVIETVKGTGLQGEKAMAAAAKWGNLSSSQVRVAIEYYGAYRREIDDWIAANRDQAERARTAWEQAQDALS